MNNKKTIRVLVIENQTLTRIGVRTILNRESDIEIVGEAETSGEGFRLYQSLRPDVTLISLRLPESCAVDEIERFLAAEKRGRIIVLADHAGDAEISRSLKQGAFGYVCKDVSETDLVKAIRTVGAGRKFSLRMKSPTS